MWSWFLSPINVYTVTGKPQYCGHLGPAPEGSVRWCTQRVASMCMWMSSRARGGWWCTVPISLCVVSKFYASWCTLYKLFANYTAWKWQLEKKYHDLVPEQILQAWGLSGHSIAAHSWPYIRQLETKNRDHIGGSLGWNSALECRPQARTRSWFFFSSHHFQAV